MVNLIRRNNKDYHIPLREMTPHITLTKKYNPTLMKNILGLKL